MDNFSESLIEKTTKVRKSGLTFAAEAGTQRLRNVINKNVTWDEIERGCRIAFNRGLYVGQALLHDGPAHRDNGGHRRHCRDRPEGGRPVLFTPKSVKGKGVQVTISCACFVPKPHTPFQSCAQDTRKLREKQKHLLQSVHSRKIKVNYHDSTTSFLEGVFAKGDRRLAPVIVAAYQKGCYFDGWEECFKYDIWMHTFARMRYRPCVLCQLRTIGLDEVTPWSHLDYGVTHEYLVREYNKALAAPTTQPCNRACSGCGANKLIGGPCFDYSKDLLEKRWGGLLHLAAGSAAGDAAGAQAQRSAGVLDAGLQPAHLHDLCLPAVAGAGERCANAWTVKTEDEAPDFGSGKTLSMPSCPPASSSPKVAPV